MGTRVCVSAATMMRCKDIDFRPIGRLLLVGKSKPIDVYEPLTPSTRLMASMADYLVAYEHMARGRPKAAEAFEELARQYPQDGLINFHASRLRAGQTGAIILMTDK